MTEPSYSPPKHHGPTLLYLFQSYVHEGDTPQAAAARLTNEIETGKIEVIPALKPGWRLVPKKGARLPRLIVDVVNRTKTASKTEFYYGPPRLDVVDVDGTHAGAEKFFVRQSTTLHTPPKPIAEPTLILQQLTAVITAALASEKPSPPAPTPAKSKLEEKLGRPLVVQLRRGEAEAWLEIIPHLQTLYDADKLPNASAARREVATWLHTDTKKRTMGRTTIYDGVDRHCVGWWD